MRGTIVLPVERREALAKAIGYEIPAEVWELRIVGYRLVVVPEPVSERTEGGVLWKPRSAIEAEQLAMGAGYIVSVGPLVGSDEHLGPAGALGLALPEDILGARVIFRQYSGAVLKTSQADTEFGGGQRSLLILTDRDVLAWRPGV